MRLIEVRRHVEAKRLWRIGKYRSVYIYRRTPHHWELWVGWYMEALKTFLGRRKLSWFRSCKEAMAEMIRLQVDKVKFDA